MLIEFKGSAGWTGQVLFNPPPADIENALPSIYLWVRGKTKEQTEAALAYLMKMFASGRECVFRVRPEVSYDGNFDTKEEWWQGIIRFSFVLGEDKWSDVAPLTSLPLGGLGVG